MIVTKTWDHRSEHNAVTLNQTRAGGNVGEAVGSVGSLCGSVSGSILLQTPECSEYHPSEQSPVVMQRSFSYQVPVIWNQLPVSVRHSTSVSSFKSLFQIKNLSRVLWRTLCPRILPTKLFSAELSLRNLDSAGKLYYLTSAQSSS